MGLWLEEMAVCLFIAGVGFVFVTRWLRFWGLPHGCHFDILAREVRLLLFVGLTRWISDLAVLKIFLDELLEILLDTHGPVVVLSFVAEPTPTTVGSRSPRR